MHTGVHISLFYAICIISSAWICEMLCMYTHTSIQTFQIPWTVVNLQCFRLKRLAFLLVWLSRNFSLIEGNTTNNSSWGTDLGVFLSVSFPPLHSSLGHQWSTQHQRPWEEGISELVVSFSFLVLCLELGWDQLIARVSEHILSHECKHLWIATNEVEGGLRLLWKSASATQSLWLIREILLGADHCPWPQGLQKLLCEKWWVGGKEGKQ